MLKIAYLLEVNPYHNSGVVKKINDQVTFWQNKGHKVEVFNIWPMDTEGSATHLNASLYSNKFLSKTLPDSFLKTYFTKILCARKVKKALHKYSPDVLYFRQNIWYPGLVSIIKTHTSIMELNTVDHFEMGFYSKLKRKVYFFGKHKVLNETNALVAVSPSILEHYNTFKGLQTVVSNGINLSTIPNSPIIKIQEKIKLIFVGSNNMVWHGLSKVFELAKMLPECEFHIAGYNKNDFPEICQPNIIFHGWVDKTSLTHLYTQCHFGIGSFGNHLVGKPTDSTLKVREYLAYGLPVLLGHYDVDFSETDFVKKITTDSNELIDIVQIKDFLITYKGQIIKKEHISIIDSKTKETERLTFFKNVIEES